MLRDFVNLFFPSYCVSCQKVLAQGERWLCTTCLAALPQTNYHLAVDNPVAQKFYGRVPITYAMAFCTFRKGNKVQKLIYQLKYGNQPAIGEALGRHYGLILSRQRWDVKFEGIIPVPLHVRRLRQRGYNQSDYLAKGLAASLAIPWHDQCLKRTKDTLTQTVKDRIGRLQNLAQAFHVAESQVVQGKHLLLVDDVITTGTTLEACALALLEAGASEISIATIGVAA